MGTLFSALYLGKAGTQVAQVQLDVTGHNIANINKEGYSRQRVDLTTRLPNLMSYGALGRGPMIAGIDRQREAFLDTVYRQQVHGLGAAEISAIYYSRIEDIFQEPGENAFSQRIADFWDALSDFANNVEALPARVSLLTESEAVAASLNEVARRIRAMQTNANEEIRNTVPEINDIGMQIVALNDIIRRSEAGGRSANDLRDDRDLLLDKLAKLVPISAIERDDGQVDVLMGGTQFIAGNRMRQLQVVNDDTINPTRPDFLRVEFADDGTLLAVGSGELGGLFNMRDGELQSLMDRVDELALGLMSSINAIQSQGRGLKEIDISLTSAYAVTDPTVPLNDSGLTFEVSDGTFDVLVFDTSGNVIETLTIPVVASGPPGGQTTLDDIAAAINASANLTATVNGDGTLTIDPGAGVQYSFANDDANLLTALGVNVLFTGDSALTMKVSQHLLNDPTLLSSRFGLDPTETGLNDAAQAMAALRSKAIIDDNTQSLDDYYQSIIVRVGINARSNAQLLQVEQAFVDDFSRRIQEVSGVSLDEEVTNLLLFQRAFEASARVISVADTMLETLINLGR